MGPGAGLVTARSPHEHGGGDVSATLSELERKLRELERELATAGGEPQAGATPPRDEPAPPAPAPAPAPPEAEPAPPPAATGMGEADRLVAEARARLGGLGTQVDDLLRFRDQLQRSARALEEEYGRLLERIGAPAQAPGAAAPTPAPTEPPAHNPLRAPIVPPPAQAPPFRVAPAAQAPAAAMPAAPPAPAPPVPGAPPPAVAPHVNGAHAPGAAPPPAAPQASGAHVPGASPLAASPHDETVFQGPVVVDAGPFTDISTLSTFEQALARVPGAEDVYVSGFEGNRALVELRLGGPVALVREMRAQLPTPFTVTEAGAARLRIEVGAGHGA